MAGAEREWGRGGSGTVSLHMAERCGRGKGGDARLTAAQPQRVLGQCCSPRSREGGGRLTGGVRWHGAGRRRSNGI
jgi:hypothetical protein